MSGGRWIFFDLGWTLVDETQAHLDRLARLQRHEGGVPAISEEDFLSLCEEQAALFAPSPFWASISRLCPTVDVSWRTTVAYDHALEVLYPGVPELLERLAESFHIGLLANQSPGASDRLRAFGIHDAFSVVISSADVGFAKPDSRIFACAEQSARAKGTDVTMVGDRLDNDIGPAKTSGWATVRVLQGFSQSQLPRHDGERPDQTIGSIGALRELD